MADLGLFHIFVGMKKICFVTSTRADWGLLKPLARLVAQDENMKLQIIATNMHLSERFGYTANEIIQDGFFINEKVPMFAEGDNEYSCVLAMSECMKGMADAFQRLKPDAVVILGDRYEMLAVASAAVVMLIPIIHIAGGEISEGAIDDSIRHAITKLSALHLTATEEYRQRVIQMGEHPDRVINTGAIGAWNARNVPSLSKEELEASLEMSLDGNIAVVTYHPATLEGTSVEELTADFLAALEHFPDLKYVVTFPNNDAHGASIIPLLEEFASKHKSTVRLVSSLGMRRYQNLLRDACMVIGNSSSGIVEVPSWGIPTVDVGIRQRGRLAADSVIHCGTETEEIIAAIKEALLMGRNHKINNPYYKEDTPFEMYRALKEFVKGLPSSPKKFYNIKFDLK